MAPGGSEGEQPVVARQAVEYAPRRRGARGARQAGTHRFATRTDTLLNSAAGEPEPMSPCRAEEILRIARQRGMTYETYTRLLEEESLRARQEPYLALNLQRTRRLEKTFQPPSDWLRLAATCPNGTFWLVITEPWCGDSAQSLPCIARLAPHLPAAEHRVLLRDSNPQVMDFYLMGGKRAIPKLNVFSGIGRELFCREPRPPSAQALFERATALGQPKEEALSELHAWYARDRCSSLAAELLHLSLIHI